MNKINDMKLFQFHKRIFEKYKSTIIADGILDAGKLISIYLALSVLMVCLFAIYAHFVFDQYNINNIHDPLPALDFDTAIQDTIRISELMHLIPLWLSSFAVFFSIPAMSFKRVVLTTSILLCVYIPVLYGVELKIFFEKITGFLMCVSITWLLSLYVEKSGQARGKTKRK